MKDRMSTKSIVYKFLLSFVLMSIIPMLYGGYLMANYVIPRMKYDSWISIEFLIVMLIVFIGYYVVSGILKSVVTVTNEAKKAAEGDQQVEVKVADGGEVGQLATSLNQIISRIRSETSALEKSQDELDGMNRKLLESYSQLHEANEKLKKMDVMKSDFVANVAHELINPLATIRETMDIMRSNLDSKMDDKQKQVMDISKRNIIRLIRLVKDILDVSRIEAGMMELNIENIDVKPMIDEVLIPLEALFKKKKMSLKKKISPGVKTLRADRDKFIQAITNLLINAVKFAPDGGEVSLLIDYDGDGNLRVEVSDNGPGIDVKDQERLFSKFERINVDKKEGTGLGLTITRDIVNLHKGKIWVESEIGKGAKFIFDLPQ